MLECQVDNMLLKSVRQAGGESFKFVSPGRAGVPDRLVILPGGRIAFIELKAPGMKPRPLQRAVLRRLYALGCKVATVDNTRTAKRMVKLWSLNHGHTKGR